MKIKIPSYFFVAIFILFVQSCKKDSDPLDAMPTTFTKKVLIEEFTAEWCAACASAFPRIQTVMEENPNTVFAATIHSNDPFSNSQTQKIKSTFSITSFPSALVDRFAFGGSTPRTSLTTSNLRNRSTERLGEPTDVGLKIETDILKDGTATVTVNAGHNSTITNELRLTVYLLEDNVPQVDQAGTSDPNYKHHHVLRKILTEEKGTPLVVGTNERDFYITSFDEIDISGYDQDNLEVIAFIHHFDESGISDHEILNVQYAKLGEDQDWD
ncbi:MAG: Omp28-related outer membrane protein [Bacteroidota bacterium]